MITTPDTTADRPLRRWHVTVSDQTDYVGWVLASGQDDAENLASDLVAEGTLKTDVAELSVTHLEREVLAEPHDQDVITRLYDTVGENQLSWLDELLTKAGLMRRCSGCESMTTAGAQCEICGIGEGVGLPGQAAAPATSPAALRWGPDDSDDAGDQSADSALVEHAYWSVGTDPCGHWGVDLIVRDDDLAETPGQRVHLGFFPSEDIAKQAAQAYEDSRGGKLYCTYGACTNAQHDHTTTVNSEGNQLPEPVPMLCNDCGLPTHWDEAISQYQHDDPDAPNCFLVQRVDPAERGR